MGACHIGLFSVTGSLEAGIKKEKWGIKKALLNWFYWLDSFNWFAKSPTNKVGPQAQGLNTIIIKVLK
jgi:hypothetical protein